MKRWLVLLCCALLVAVAFGVASLELYFPGTGYWGPGLVLVPLVWAGMRAVRLWFPPPPLRAARRRWLIRFSVGATATCLALFAIATQWTVAWVWSQYGAGISRGSFGAAWGRAGLVFWIPTQASGARPGLYTRPAWHARNFPVVWLPDLRPSRTGGVSTPLWLPAVIGLIGTVWLARGDHPKLGHCARCGYDLTGNVSGRCPECGTVVASGSARGNVAGAVR